MASCTCQTLLIERMLYIYEDMFKDMKEKSNNEDVQNRLGYLMDEVNILRRNYSKELEVWGQLQNMNRTLNIEVNIKRKSCLHCEKCTFLVVELLFMIGYNMISGYVISNILYDI